MRTALFTMITIALTLTSGSVFASDIVDHAPFDTLLSEYVDAQGRVAYAKWHDDKGDMKKLDAYLETVAAADPSDGSEDAQLAFYINAYNAHVVDELLDQWPVKNPMKVEGFFKKIKHDVAGKKMTLDKLEHGLIRERFSEPRIHFVLNCAAQSCPKLQRDALTASNLEATLASATKEFVPAATSLKDGKVVTSQLFNWFAEDFVKAEGSVAKYLAKYEDGEVAEALKSDDVEITFSTYDWAINSQ
ncbi:MAG: DUF547 domain-containing protein [Myxococcota bacterium]